MRAKATADRASARPTDAYRRIPFRCSSRAYTALSRARGQTQLHIDASDTKVALERSELGGADHHQPPDRAQVLARTRAQMLIRDDEDLAMSQLPTPAAAGRSDDRDLQAAHGPADPERGAERTEPVRPTVSVAQLLKLQHERARLTAQTAALPLAELRQLDAISADRARVQTQRRDVTDRLDALPSPTRSALGRPRDPHAAERARLSAAVGAADQQINALDTQADRLQRTIGPAAAIQQERAGLEARINELDHDTNQVRDELAERDVAARPAWTRKLLGDRPEQYQRAEYWDRAVREVARYRIEQHIEPDTPGLGPEPTGGPARGQWRQAERVVQQTQRRLGRNVDQDRGLDRERRGGLERPRAAPQARLYRAAAALLLLPQTDSRRLARSKTGLVRRVKVAPFGMPPRLANQQDRVAVSDRDEVAAERAVRRRIVKLVRRTRNIRPIADALRQVAVVLG